MKGIKIAVIKRKFGVKLWKIRKGADLMGFKEILKGFRTAPGLGSLLRTNGLESNSKGLTLDPNHDYT